MGYKNRCFFAQKMLVFGVGLPQQVPVNIAVHGFHRFKSFQSAGNFLRANIAGVPYLVAFFKVVKHPFIEVAMRVGNYANSGHEALLLWFQLCKGTFIGGNLKDFLRQFGHLGLPKAAWADVEPVFTINILMCCVYLSNFGGSR